MKMIRIMLVAIFATFTAHAAPLNWGLVVGYEGMKAGDVSYLHNTHPADGFLPQSGVAGSAGKTDLSDELLDFGSIGFRYQPQLLENVHLNIEAGWMFGNGRDEKQNANDPRPSGSGAFIYSKVSNATYGSLGITYDIPSIKGLYVGVDARITVLFIEHGWYRYGSDESAKTETNWSPMLCPKIGYKFDENIGLEASALIGDSIGGAVQFIWSF